MTIPTILISSRAVVSGVTALFILGLTVSIVSGAEGGSTSALAAFTNQLETTHTILLARTNPLPVLGSALLIGAGIGSAIGTIVTYATWSE